VPEGSVYELKIMGMNKGQLITFLAFLAVPVFAIIVKFNEYEHFIVWVASFSIIGALVYIYQSVDVVAKKRLLVIVYYTILMSCFWAIFEQAGSSLTLFADRNINLIGINAAQTNSINSGFIIFLAIPFSWLWAYLTRVGENPNSAIKSGLGLLLLGLGFVVFAMSANSADTLAQTPMWYLVVGYFVLTVGELFISPIGLSKMTELSPVKFLAFMMGVFFTSSFYGHFFAGKIAKLTTVEEGATNLFAEGAFGQITQLITGLSPSVSQSNDAAFQQLYSYVSVYAIFGVLTILLGIFALVISPKVKELMGGIR